jgi:hypothetical protein
VIVYESERAARAAVASLCGLVLRRLQEDKLSRSPDRNAMEDVLDERLSAIFGEALQQFSSPAEVVETAEPAEEFEVVDHADADV